jgi:hypothetical protein
VTADDTRSIVHAYHHAWTSKHFDRAIRLLSPALEVEVPINHYPTTESFGRALVAFGTRVDLLRAPAAGVEPSPA